MEASILKAMLNKPYWETYKGFIKPENFTRGKRSPFYKMFVVLSDYHTTYDDPLTPESLKTIHLAQMVGEDTKSREKMEKAYVELSEAVVGDGVEALFKAFRITDLRFKVEELMDANNFDKAQGVLEEINAIEAEDGVIHEDESLYMELDLEALTTADDESAMRWFLPQLDDIAGTLTKGTSTLVLARSNAGKCLGKDTPVIMADGTIEMVQDVVNGDKVMGYDGTPRTVQGVVKGRAPMYRVSYKDGDSYTVNDAHILSLKKVGTDEIVNINVEEYLQKSDRFKSTHKGWRTKWDGGHNKKLHLNPYFLGLWLGDGSCSKPEICNGSEVVGSWLKDNFNTNLYVNAKTPTYYIRGIKEYMDGYNLTYNKHIPSEFKTAEKHVRQQVLAGLIDTDGYVGGHYVEITQKSKTLADDIVWIARSLGLRATVKSSMKKAQGWVEPMQYWRISIRGDLYTIPTKLKDVSGIRNNKGRDRYAIKVEAIGEDEYFGFTLKENPLFVLGDWTVTHNTSFIIPQTDKLLTSGYNVLHVCLSEDGREELAIRYAMGAFKCTQERVLRDKPKTTQALNDRYEGRLRIINTGRMSAREIEAEFERLKKEENFVPDLVVYDQYQKMFVKTNSSANTAEVRTEVSQRIKDFANKFGHHALCATQADQSSGWTVTEMNVDGSKTGVVGEFKTIIGLGKEDDDRPKVFLDKEGKQCEGLKRNVNVAKNKGKLGMFTAYLVADKCHWIEE